MGSLGQPNERPEASLVQHSGSFCSEARSADEQFLAMTFEGIFYFLWRRLCEKQLTKLKVNLTGKQTSSYAVSHWERKGKEKISQYLDQEVVNWC